MMAREHNNERAEEIARINERGAVRAAYAAQLLCRETVDLAYDSVELHLQADREQHQRLADDRFPVGEVRGYFVLQDKLTAPREEGEFQRTFSIRLEPVARRADHSYMKLHVPAGETRIQTYQMPPKEEVDKVYVELAEDGDVHWYAVQNNGLYEYIPYVKQDDDSSVLSDQGIWQWINDRIPESGEAITKILRHAVNWETVPQRIEPIQKITLHDPER